MTSHRSPLTCPVPEGWFANDSVTVTGPDGQANVIASTEAVDAGLDSKRYASTQGELLLDKFPDYLEISFESSEIFGGRSGYIRQFEWTPPDGDRVTQIQIYYAEDGRGYTATATALAREFDRFERVLLEVLRGLVISI